MSLLTSAENIFRDFYFSRTCLSGIRVSNSMDPDNTQHLLARSRLSVLTKFNSERALAGNYSL